MLNMLKAIHITNVKNVHHMQVEKDVHNTTSIFNK
jgi:hypothetical protein